MTRTPEERLVLTASRVRMDDAAVGEIRSLLQGAIDWVSVLRMAIPHGTLPLMARNFRQVARDLVPADLLRQIEAYAVRVRIGNEKATRELADALGELKHHGVEATPFKGCVLQATLYEAPELREFYDLDLVIGREQIPPALEAMKSLGYRLHPEQQNRLEEVLRIDHALKFVQEGRVTVEIHWRFSDTWFDNPLDPARLREKIETILIGGVVVRTFGSQSTLLILSAHQARHRWRRLNWLCDISALVETHAQLDWHAALTWAQEDRCERFVLTTLALTKLLLGTTLPSVIEHRLEHERNAYGLAKQLASVMPSAPQKPRSTWPHIRMREDIGMHEGNRLAVTWRYLAAKIPPRLGLATR